MKINSLDSYYGVEVGVLLNKDDNEFDAYAVNNEKLPYGFYDEDQEAFGGWDLENEKASALKYVENGVDGTYAIISDQGAIGNIGGVETTEDAVKAFDEGLELDYNYFKDARDIVYSVAKINGETVEGFLERELLLLGDESYQYCTITPPGLEKIKQDYKELMGLIKDVRTFDDAKNFQDKYKIEVEINGEPIKNINPDDNIEIEWIRYDHYGCLGYVYDRFDGKPMFDVYYGEYGEDQLADCVQIDEFTEANYAKMLEAVSKFKVSGLIDNAVKRSEVTNEGVSFDEKDIEME